MFSRTQMRRRFNTLPPDMGLPALGKLKIWRMNLLALSITLLVPAAFGADSAPDLRGKFVGSWKLISIEGPNQTSNGKPFGMIMYDSTGYVSVHIVRGDRLAFRNGRTKATDKEKAVAFDTYTAYYGTYTFDPENRIVIHHLEGSLSVLSLRLRSVDRQLPDFDRHVGRYSAGTRRG